MENQINEDELELEIKEFNFWNLYKYDQINNRSLEFDQKGNFAVTVNQKTIYQGKLLKKAVEKYNWDFLNH